MDHQKVFPKHFLSVIQQEARNLMAPSDGQNLAQLCLTFNEQKPALA